ncbi:MAG: type III-B CRISPR-associated protein Cas10/Cmr2 [Phaeodactylibacter sp.]|nr:type III-B CRISPR-associated protein Cas10/Cmr2 [Phaeodactylibacter sp.]
MTYLFLFAIGPVQNFIAQARKTRDLYAGSRILSDLARVGMDACKRTAKSQGATFKPIFPDYDRTDTEASLPNRFIVKLTYADEPAEAQLRTLAGNTVGGVEHAVRGRFREIAQEALESCNLSAPGGFWQQIDNHLDIHWAFQPVERGKYREAYRALEHLLNSVKNVRPFAQLTYQDGVDFGERGRKCNLDGENNALFYRKRQNTVGGWESPAMIRHNGLIQNSDLTFTSGLNDSEWSQGEALSGISTVKRFFKRGESLFKGFPSTARMALYKSLAEHSEACEYFEAVFNIGKLIGSAGELKLDTKNWTNFNDQFYYEENLTTVEIPNSQQLQLAKERHAQLKQAGFKFDKYYAVLAFDGDQMGKWFSGDKLKDGAGLEPFHSDLSQKLSAFGREAKKIVDDENRGKTVYAGGDDYLGFLNLHYLFEAVTELRKKFHELVNNDLLDKNPGEELTFSAGIVVAHYKEPLGMVVQRARDMEKAAKKQGGRNAFGLAVVKASGEVQQTVYKWDKDPDNPNGCSNWEALGKVFSGLKKVYSNRFITNMSLEFYTLAGLSLDDFGKVSPKAFGCEIERLVAKAKVEKDSHLDIIPNVKELFSHRWIGASYNQAENFVHGLHIVDFLHRKLS